MIAIDLSKQQALDTDPKAMQHISFSGNLDRAEGATMFFITEEAKETVLDFSQGTVKVLSMSSYLFALVAKVSNRKIFDRTARSTILFCSV